MLMSASHQPYQRTIASRFPDQRTIFASWNRPRDVKSLHEMIVSASYLSYRRIGIFFLNSFYSMLPAFKQRLDIARENAHVSNELNVLVVGMPNVGKSTLLNALRNMGIPGRTSSSPVTTSGCQLAPHHLVGTDLTSCNF